MTMYVFQSLALQPGARVHYAERVEDLKDADLIVLPGTKNTIEDLIDLRNRYAVACGVLHAEAAGVVGVRNIFFLMLLHKAEFFKYFLEVAS